MSFSVMTWNILSELYIRPEEYKHLEEEKKVLLDWPNRLSNIIDIITKIKPDIVLLQEVTLSGFEEDFAILFEHYNYVIHKQNKNRTSPIGNAIIFNKHFKLIEEKHKTKSIHVKLEITDNKIVCISNVHFISGLRRREIQRMAETSSCLTVWSNEANVIIAGDYNDNFTNEEGIKALFITNGFINSGRLDKLTCVSRGIAINCDHILTKGVDSREKELLFDISKHPIPNELIGSDHLPVMSIISFTQ